MNRIYITDYVSDPYIEKDIIKEELSDRPQEKVEVLLVWHKCIDKLYMSKFPGLKGIVRYGVGYDSIDLDFAKNSNIYVCNTPDYGTEEVSDTALSFILNIARGVTRYDFECRKYEAGWQENTIEGIRRTSQVKLGVIGAGRIGGSILLKAKALGFSCGFFDPYKESGYEKMIGAERFYSVVNLLRNCDLVSVNCPLTEETFNLVDEDFVRNMKDGSSLINTARGQIVKDLDLLYDALKDNRLSCLALDVLPEEPPPDCRLIKAWKAREDWLGGRLLINPHTAYFSEDSYEEMRTKAAKNALMILKGHRPLNIVNGL